MGFDPGSDTDFLCNLGKQIDFFLDSVAPICKNDTPLPDRSDKAKFISVCEGLGGYRDEHHIKAYK